MGGSKYATGRDYGLWIDVDTGGLNVFGPAWTYNLPSTDGVFPLNNRMVIAVEEPQDPTTPASRPSAGGFMLGNNGQIIGVGHYDPGYWAAFPPGESGVVPNIRIAPTVTGHIDIAGSSQMGTWTLDSTGLPKLVYISPNSTNFTAINTGTFPRPKPIGSGYVSIAVGRQNVYLLNGVGGIVSFGFGTAPVPVYPTDLVSDADSPRKLVASTTHVGYISNKGRIVWWPEDPADTATITSIQTRPTTKIFSDLALGAGYSYALIANDQFTDPGVVRGYGVPLDTAAGSFVRLTLPGHNVLAQAPPVYTWGWAAILETAEHPFGITPFGLMAVTLPPAAVAPGSPIGFQVSNYNGITNEIFFEWEGPLTGSAAKYYEIAHVPLTGGTPPTVPPDGTVTVIMPHAGDREDLQMTSYQITDDFHGPSYYMIRSIGVGGIPAGGASPWVYATYDNTLLEGDWRKLGVSVIDYDCSSGGYVIMLEIDQVVPLADGWTGAAIIHSMVPDGIFYILAETKISVAREKGPTVASQETAMADVNGLGNVTIPASPKLETKAIVDYEINIEDGYIYWIHDDAKAIVTGRENAVRVDPLLDTCQSQLSNPHYLRDLQDPANNVTSEFCLGTLDQLDYEIRSGVFSVLGRPAPVVVVDSRSTAKGRLTFLSSGDVAEEVRTSLHELQSLFRLGHPMMLQTVKSYELGGGQLYFQPTNVSDRWIGSDARRAEHALEVDFIEIDPPRGRVILRNIGIPLSAEPGTVLTRTSDYVDSENSVNPLFGIKFCDGGMKEQYEDCNALLLRTCNEVLHTPAETVC